jgi:hypothetical protein
MVSVVALTMGMLVALGMAGFTFNNFLFQRAHAQAKADALAIKLAAEINEGDRVGQLNELECASRELVYVSRQQVKKCQQDEEYDFLSPLCQQLLAESRYGHEIVERERQNQINLIDRDIQREASDHNCAASGQLAFSIPWLQIQDLRIMRVDVGHIENIESNVKDLSALEDLSDFDMRRGYVDRVTNLYRANINASLPDADGDLCFKLSSLPSYVEETCAPARNTNQGVFVRTGTIFNDGHAVLASIDQVPNAVQITYALNTTVGLRDRLESDVTVISTGITNGAIAGSE